MLFSLTICITWLTVKDEFIKKLLINGIIQYLIVLFQYVMTIVINVHNPQWIPRCNGICVANHTSPIDISILFAHNYYILVINYESVNCLKKAQYFFISMAQFQLLKIICQKGNLFYFKKTYTTLCL